MLLCSLLLLSASPLLVTTVDTEDIVNDIEDDTAEDIAEDMEGVDLEPGQTVTLAGGLTVTMVRRGPGRCVRRAADGDRLGVEYVARYLGPGGDLVDSTDSRGSPFLFQLGGGGDRGGRVIGRTLLLHHQNLKDML